MTRRWIERLGLIGLGLALALVVLEASLQIGAAYLRRTAFDRPAQWTRQARRVLCLGDSNTYGVQVRRGQTYPAVLERLWNGQAGRPEVEVLNLGVPGTNSSRLRNNFRSLLASFRPHTVLVLVGANDLWTLPAPPDEETQLTAAQLLWQRSRVFRLLFMLARAASGTDAEEKPEIIFTTKYAGGERKGAVRLGDREFDLTFTGSSARMRGWDRALAGNLHDMRKAADEAGVELVLLTYAWDAGAYGFANRVIRAARADDLPVIDLAGSFAKICPRRNQPRGASANCPGFFFEDGHPTRLGYQVVAATIWRELARLHGATGEPSNEASWTAVLAPETRDLLAAAGAPSPDASPTPGARTADR